MYQFAFSYLVAKRCGSLLYLDINDIAYNNYKKKYAHRIWLLDSTFELNDSFKLGLSIPEEINKNKIFRKLFRESYLLIKRLQYIKQQTYNATDTQFEKIYSNVYLEGLWAAHDTFDIYREELLNLFKFGEAITKKYASYQTKLSNEQAVGVHVRRGDYLWAQHTSYNICNLEYYKKCVDSINRKVKDPIFYIFSDDINWCKKSFDFIPSDKVVHVDFTDNSKPGEDLYLMSLCSHFIIANSSFSYWGAFLSKNPKKLVLAPKRWFERSKSYQIPSNFIGIEF